MYNFIYVLTIVLRLTNIFSKASVSRANLNLDPVPIHFNFESNLNLTLLFVICHSYSKAILHVSDSLFEVFS